MPVVPVVVVGAGPVGLTAALLLARRGVDVLVLERHREPYPLPRAVHLDGEVFRALQAAGVADEVAAVSRPMAGMRLLDGGLRPFAEFPRPLGAGPDGWPRGVLFHQPDLEAVLRTAVARAPQIRLEMGREVVGLSQDDDAVALTVRDRVAGADRSVSARYVLGCDGANSTVRELVGARLRGLARPDRWFVVDLRPARPPDVWAGVHQVCDPLRAATFMPLTGGRFRWEFRMAPGERADDLAAGLDRLLAPYGVGAVEVDRAAEYVFRAAVADRWRVGRVLLAGDAAHLTPPFIGQGIGLGLRDVHQLAWKLAAVLAGDAADDLLTSYQAERAPHARALIRLALVVGRLMTAGGRGAAVVRRVVLAALLRVPAVAALAGADTRTPALRAGPLVGRGRLAGTLVPQPEVLLDGRRCRLDDVLGPDGAEILLLEPDRLRIVRDDGTVDEVTDVDGVLTAWLSSGGAGRARVRADRIVRSAG